MYNKHECFLFFFEVSRRHLKKKEKHGWSVFVIYETPQDGICVHLLFYARKRKKKWYEVST